MKTLNNKSSVILYREVKTGYWKEWTNSELEENTRQLRNSKQVCASMLLKDDLDPAVRQQLAYDHEQISQALRKINSIEPFDGRIEPKKELFVPENIEPFIIKNKDNRLTEFVLLMFIATMIFVGLLAL